jgi:NAD(P)-dependent dehydrogenase (short-subunit alcohol dehydrogenase family)
MATHGSIRIFSGAVALITGAASGIGKALTEGLSKRGCVVVAADRDLERAQEVAKTVQQQGRVATASGLDVRDLTRFQDTVSQTFETHGRLDFLFNNAGVGGGGEVIDSAIEDWREVIEVNLFGVVHGVLAAYPLMRRQGFGHIVNTASMAGLIASPLTASYSTTKHAVVGLSKALRAEAACAGVRVSVLCPGAVRTPLLEGGMHGILSRENLGEAERKAMREFFERLRPMEPSRFAEAALDAVARNKAIIIVPSWWRALWWIDRLSPSLSLVLAQRLFERSQGKSEL